MRSFIRLTQFDREDLFEIFRIADTMERYSGFLSGKTVVMFFPESSIRTRVAFEKGIYLLGGQSVLFPPEALDKREDIRDVCGYLQNWADAVIVRHRDIGLLDKMAACLDIPVINAMTDENHPCEITADLYALSKRRADFLSDRYLFAGPSGNIGKAWKEASDAFGFPFAQSCPARYRMPGAAFEEDLEKAVTGRDIICTDSLPEAARKDFAGRQITKKIMALANPGALLDPCPPFYRGEEVSADVLDSPYFVGYGFKKDLLKIQQAILIYGMTK